MAECSRVELAEASAVLAGLGAGGAPYVVVGSLARHWLGQPLDRLPRDVDILVPGDLDSLNRLGELLCDLEFALYSWQEPVRPPFDLDRLRGRYYMRAIRESGLSLDATYESPLLPFADAWRRREQVSGIAVACAEDLERFRWPRE